MNTNSHRLIAHHIIDKYLIRIHKYHKLAFILGCIEPDKNPVTYLKGSLRFQWLRGHNWSNAMNYILRLSARLNNRKYFSARDYYNLGKLIHYAADAFTYSHNLHFLYNLKTHRIYEQKLEVILRRKLLECGPDTLLINYSIPEILQHCRKEYMQMASGVEADSKYSLLACCSIAYTCSVRHSLSCDT